MHGGADDNHTGEHQKSESKMETRQRGERLIKTRPGEQQELEVLRVICAFIDVLSTRTSRLAQTGGGGVVGGGTGPSCHPVIPPSRLLCVSAPAPDWGPVCH